MPSEHPNIIFISAEQQRADTVRAGGAEATVYGAPGLTANSLIRAASRYVPIEGALLLR